MSSRHSIQLSLGFFILSTVLGYGGAFSNEESPLVQSPDLKYQASVRAAVKLPLKQASDEMLLYKRWDDLVSRPGELSKRLSAFVSNAKDVLDIDVPRFWVKHLASGHCDRHGNSGFTSKLTLSYWRKYEGSLLSGATALKVQASEVGFTLDEMQFMVPIRVLSERVSSEITDPTTDAALITAAVCLSPDHTQLLISQFAGYPYTADWPLSLISINAEGEKVWESPVDSGIGQIATGVWNGSYVEVCTSKHSVFIFGVSDLGAYIGRYDLRTGRRTLRFCTSHIGG